MVNPRVYFGKVGILTLCSFASVASVFSVLSIGSSFSVLSIGSHASFLSIGCTNRMFSVCNQKKHPQVPVAPTDSTTIITQVESVPAAVNKATGNHESLESVWAVFDRASFFYYYTALVSSGATDRYCRGKTSAGSEQLQKLAFDGKELYAYAPNIDENTAKCKPYHPAGRMPRTVPTCAPMRICFENKECSSAYRTFAKNYKDNFKCEIRHGNMLITYTLLVALGIAFYAGKGINRVIRGVQPVVNFTKSIL